MTFTSILTHVEPGEAGTERLSCAIELANRFGALLIGVGAQTLAPGTFTDPYGMTTVEWQAQVLEQARASLDAAGAKFETQASGCMHDWRASFDSPLRALCREARRADLIIAGGTPLHPTTPAAELDVGQLVLHAGRPVMIAPPTPCELQPERILVAWKDTREARCAVTDALPFLVKAEAVLVVNVCDLDDAGPAQAATDDVVAFLARHGVKAGSTVIPGKDDEACAKIQDEAQAMRAGLIVAGGYGRSRLREWVFGGVTLNLLRHPERYVFMSH